MTFHFSSGTMRMRKDWSRLFQVLRENIGAAARAQHSCPSHVTGKRVLGQTHAEGICPRTTCPRERVEDDLQWEGELHGQQFRSSQMKTSERKQGSDLLFYSFLTCWKRTAGRNNSDNILGDCTRNAGRDDALWLGTGAECGGLRCEESTLPVR